MFEYREFDVTKYALPEDRPADFHGIHGSGNPNDGHKLDDAVLEGANLKREVSEGGSSDDLAAAHK